MRERDRQTDRQRETERERVSERRGRGEHKRDRGRKRIYEEERKERYKHIKLILIRSGH